MTTQELKQSIEKVLGNNIRCLLPSYWWKRLFNQVADRIDEVEQSTSELIEASKMPIVESESNLSQLDLPKGSVASVVKESVTVKISDCFFSENLEEDWEKYTIVKRVEEKANITIDKQSAVAFSASKDWLNGEFQISALDSGVFLYLRYIDGHYIETTLSNLNKALSSGNYRAIGNSGEPDQYFTFYSEMPRPELYIKGETWERLAKESDLGGIEDESGDDNVVTFYAPTDISRISDTEKQHNAESYQKVAEGFESDKYYDVKVLMSTSQLVIFDAIQILNPAIDDGKLKLMFRWVGDGREQILTVTSDGSTTTETKESHFDSELSETSENPVQNKVVTEALNEKADKTYVNNAITSAITTTLNTEV